MPAWLFGLTFSLNMRCIASGSILGLVCIPARLPVRLLRFVYVPVVPVYWASMPPGLAIVDLCGQLPCGKNKVSHLGNSLIMIITAKILKIFLIDSESCFLESWVQGLSIFLAFCY